MTVMSDKRTWIALVSGLLLGLLVGRVWFLANDSVSAPEESEKEVQKKILYWVAPMDPDFRKDVPGKSPMGMDLIPVYDEPLGNADEGPGTIRISSNVVYNLGVRTIAARRDILRSDLRTVGYVQYDEDLLIHIHTRVEGWIKKLYVKSEGDPIVNNQPLYELYSPALVNAQEELVLAIERDNDRLVQASKNRHKALHLPESVINEISRSREVKQNIIFSAPQDGVIDNLNIREGFFVTPNKTLMSIGSLKQVWVEAEIFERQAASVTTGKPVSMTLDYLPGRIWQGEVEYIYPTLDPQTRAIRVRLRFSNENRELKPNMFAQVTIHTSSEDKMLLIPREAVIRTGNRDRVVLALGGGSYKSVEVQIGRSDEEDIEILSGLTEGEEVVVSAQFLLDSESSKSSDFQRMNKPESLR